MNMEIEIAKGIPGPICQRAKVVLNRWLTGDIRSRRATSTNDIQILEVGRCYRMIQFKERQWQLMSHEAYNKTFKNLK